MHCSIAVGSRNFYCEIYIAFKCCSTGDIEIYINRLAVLLELHLVYTDRETGIATCKVHRERHLLGTASASLHIVGITISVIGLGYCCAVGYVQHLIHCISLRLITERGVVTLILPAFARVTVGSEHHLHLECAVETHNTRYKEFMGNCL